MSLCPLAETSCLGAVLLCNSFSSWNIFSPSVLKSCLINSSVVFNSSNLYIKKKNIFFKFCKFKKYCYLAIISEVGRHSQLPNCPFPALMLIEILLIASDSACGVDSQKAASRMVRINWNTQNALFRTNIAIWHYREARAN